MPWRRPYAINTTGVAIPGTDQFGDFAIGYPLNGPSSVSHLKWYAGPDETHGYVIAYISDTLHTTPDGSQTYLRFKRSAGRSEAAFIELAEKMTGQNFQTGTGAMMWLHQHGYWSSWEVQSNRPLKASQNAGDAHVIKLMGDMSHLQMDDGSGNRVAYSRQGIDLNALTAFDLQCIASTGIDIDNNISFSTTGFSQLSGAFRYYGDLVVGNKLYMANGHADTGVAANRSLTTLFQVKDWVPGASTQYGWWHYQLAEVYTSGNAVMETYIKTDASGVITEIIDYQVINNADAVCNGGLGSSTSSVSPICADPNVVVQINDGPIGEPVTPLVTYYGSRYALSYNSVTPSTYQAGSTDYTVNFTVNSFNFDNKGDDVDCITSATGETTIGVWTLKKGKSNPNNNVIGVDDQVTAGQMMYPAYLTQNSQAYFTPMYGENNPIRPFSSYFINNSIASPGVYARTEIRINSVDGNGVDRETELDQLIGNSGILTFRQNPIFKTNINTPDVDACWYTVENYAKYRFDANAFYKVLQPDGSYTYYYSPDSQGGTALTTISNPEPNMGGSGTWTGQSWSGSLQRGETPNNFPGGANTTNGIRPFFGGTIQCNGFTSQPYPAPDFTFTDPISISIEVDP